MLAACLALWVAAAPAEQGRVVHVFTALADNATQGIVPVPAKLGNGDDPINNVYWGAAYGVKTFFGRHPDWAAVVFSGSLPSGVLERAIFKHRRADVTIVADAYRGAEIARAIGDFLNAAAGEGEPAALVAYVGHDGLMDFPAPQRAQRQEPGAGREAIVLACASKRFFAEPLRAAGARPLLWTTGLMAPEAYTLAAALDGWIAGESKEHIHSRAALAYDRYQKCGVKGAKRLFATGW